MPAGIEIKNDQGYIQITEDYHNYQKYSKATVAFGNYNPSYSSIDTYNNRYYHWVNNMKNDEIIAFWCTGLNGLYDITKWVGLLGMPYKQLNYDETYTTTFTFLASPNTRVHIVRFRANNIYPGKCFEVYDKDGQLAFSDFSAPMCVNGLFSDINNTQYAASSSPVLLKELTTPDIWNLRHNAVVVGTTTYNLKSTATNPNSISMQTFSFGNSYVRSDYRLIYHSSTNGAYGRWYRNYNFITLNSYNLQV
jgi:hypothetical protein